MSNNSNTLHHHLTEVQKGNRGFENAFQGVSRMILESKIEKVVVNGKTTYDFSIFREGSRNGKTFLVEFLSAKYRSFLSLDKNRKYTFRFVNTEKIGHYGKINTIESQTYEDPMILGMNLFDDPDQNREYLAKQAGFSDKEIDELYENYRPLGACSGYIWNDIRNITGNSIDEMLKFIEIIPVPLTESLGTVTGKYPAKDKITSSSVDLLGEESIQRLLHITDTNNPYRFDLRRGALARVAGGG
jgi:serine protein kinase